MHLLSLLRVQVYNFQVLNLTNSSWEKLIEREMFKMFISHLQFVVAALLCPAQSQWGTYHDVVPGGMVLEPQVRTGGWGGCTHLQ